MFAINKWSQDRCTKRIMYLKRKKRKQYVNSHYIPQNINIPTIKKTYVNSPRKYMTNLKYMTTLIPKLLPLFVTNDKW